MTPFEREEVKRRAQAKLAALRERAARLRRRVLMIAAVGFVALWAAIFVQMVTGNDPALAPATAPAATRESATSDPERRVFVEAEAAAEAAELEAEAEAAETEELEAATTGQS